MLTAANILGAVYATGKGLGWGEFGGGIAIGRRPRAKTIRARRKVRNRMAKLSRRRNRS